MEEISTKRYLLEIGQFLPSPPPKTYARLAVNVLHLWRFEHESLSDSKDALIARYERLFKQRGCHAKITDRKTDEVVFETKSNRIY